VSEQEGKVGQIKTWEPKAQDWL